MSRHDSIPEPWFSFLKELDALRAVQISELFGSVGLILLDELQLQTSICEPGLLATFLEFIAVAVVGAKNEPLFPGRVPHFRQSVHGLKKTAGSPFVCFCNTAKKLPPIARVLAH